MAPLPRGEDDPGVAVELFENPNLDGYLRRAQDLLAQQKYDAAITVLQDVVEGRTVEFVDSAPQPEEGPADKPGDKAPAKPERKKTLAELDSSRAVFSPDGRLYRPVRRLCHEILAQLPEVGIELYRTSYEVAAREMLEQALRDGSVAALEQVAGRYFVTVAAGKAMVALADRLMHEGRFRGAVQVLRDLVEVYPVDNRRRVGISEVWCRFKIALCLHLAGETTAAQAAVRELAAAFPDESLRILGELQAVRDLPQSAAFGGELQAVAPPPRAETAIGWLSPATERLVPLWQFRFRNPDPYREPKSGNNDGVVWNESGQATAMPFAGRYGPGTHVQFPAPVGAEAQQVVFLEHYRLRVADALSGLQLRESQGPIDPGAPNATFPRVRIAASDFALLRPVDDEERRYFVVGHPRPGTQSTEVLKASELLALRRADLAPAWSSTQWLDGDEGLRDVTFLAAPAVFGERLLLPALRKSAYTLQCLDRRTGRPLWHTPLHAGGTRFFKAPGAPVCVQGGVAFVLTNAGCLAAVDAFTGALRWIRRYEREDPLRPRARPKSRPPGDGGPFGGQQYAQAELPGFHANDLVPADGLVVFAPCDGNLLLCLDGASGQVVWMLDGSLTRFTPYGQLRTIVGATTGDLFVLSDRHLVCIGLRGGLVKWCRELPQWNPPRNTGRGRGTVVGDQIVLPGERELLVFDAAGERPMRRLSLPPFGTSRDPLAGSYHLASAGPWLAVGYPGGIELFSSREALLQLAAAAAAAPLAKANFLVHAGELPAAEAALRDCLLAPALPAGVQAEAASRLLALVRERALAAARGGDRAAVDQLDPLLPFASDRTVRLNWHLARLEVCKEAGDLRAHEHEQQRLYDFMEGRG